jgi:hypothetical protein
MQGKLLAGMKLTYGTLTMVMKTPCKIQHECLLYELLHLNTPWIDEEVVSRRLPGRLFSFFTKERLPVYM